MSYILYFNKESKTRYPNPDYMLTQGFSATDPEIVSLDYTMPEYDNTLESLVDPRTEVEVDGVWKIDWQVNPLADEVIYDNHARSYLQAIERLELQPLDVGNGVKIKTDAKSAHLLNALIVTKQNGISLTLSDPVCVEGGVPEGISELLAIQSQLTDHINFFKSIKEQVKDYLVGSNVEVIKTTTPDQWVSNLVANK